MCASKTARVEKVCELSLYAVTCLSASLRVYWEAYSRTSGHALAAFDHDNQDFITCEVGFGATCGGLPEPGSMSSTAESYSLGGCGHSAAYMSEVLGPFPSGPEDAALVPKALEVCRLNGLITTRPVLGAPST